MSHLQSQSRVLLVEDEVDVAQLVRHALEREGDIRVDVVASGDMALRSVEGEPPDLILLDLNVPVLSGLDVCRILRTRPNSAETPILMLTASSSEDDRVACLNVGADDYITKPFSLRELTARVRRALTRHHQRTATPETDVVVYQDQHLTADFDAVDIRVDGTPIRLTRREFELLRFLIRNRNRVVSRDRLLERVWGLTHAIDTRSVDVHIARLRAKLGLAGRQIETLIGLGYRFVEAMPPGSID